MSAAPLPTLDAARSGSGATFEHRPSLDGMRAIAALLVILFHAGVPSLSHGYTGVDVFFVLSGFLITSLLVRELLETGRLRFVAFYARRVRRLLPAALFVLLATAVAYEAVASPVAVSQNKGGFIASALYFANWYFLAQSQDYFAEEAHRSPVQHYWSLSVEEQFYVVWPALVLGLVLLSRRYRFRLEWAAGALAVTGAVYAGILAKSNPMASYFGTGARAYQLLLGAAIALLILRWERSRSHRPPPRYRIAGPLVAAAGLVLVLLAGSPFLGTESPYWHGIGAAAGTGALLLGLELAPLSLTGRVLAWGPARTIGRWSYAAYLWHWPVIIVGDEAGALPHAWFPRTLIVVLLTLALSGATFHFIERPTRRIGLRSSPRQRLVAAAGIAMAVTAALVFSAVLQVDARAEAVLKTADKDAGKPVIVKGQGTGAPTMLLAGDSHAHYLYPAFAELASRQGWSLVPVTKDACPWPAVQATADREAIQCDDMRTAMLQAAARYHPEIAVLMSRSIVKRPLLIDGDIVDPGAPGWLDEVKRGTEEFLAQLRPLVGAVVIVSPLPETEEPMVDCLASGGDAGSCSAPATHRPGTSELDAYWRTLPGVKTISLDQLICPDGTCPAVVDGIPTHRDTNHLTVGYSRHLAPKLDRYLRSLGVDLGAGAVETG
ncbi:MAG TPA: acyltransferase family protein [Gaiellaceae bacterium]|nr:acyltransferase family protein [Gaiellaceae bacterium]